MSDPASLFSNIDFRYSLGDIPVVDLNSRLNVFTLPNPTSSDISVMLLFSLMSAQLRLIDPIGVQVGQKWWCS